MPLFCCRLWAYIRRSSLREGGGGDLLPSSARARISKPNFMTDDAETRRRRAAYRACHRGTKEMDWILGRYAESALGAMSVDGLAVFERLLTLPDPDLQDMVLHPELTPAGEEDIAVAPKKTSKPVADSLPDEPAPEASRLEPGASRDESHGGWRRARATRCRRGWPRRRGRTRR